MAKLVSEMTAEELLDEFGPDVLTAYGAELRAHMLPLLERGIAVTKEEARRKSKEYREEDIFYKCACGHKTSRPRYWGFPKTCVCPDPRFTELTFAAAEQP